MTQIPATRPSNSVNFRSRAALESEADEVAVGTASRVSTKSTSAPFGE